MLTITKYEIVIGLIIGVITLCVFLPSLGNDYVNWDDPHNILENLSFRGLNLENLRWIFIKSFFMGNYEPLHWLSMAIDYSVWGLKPIGYHLTSILLHAIAATLLYIFLQKAILSYSIKSSIVNRKTVNVAAGLAALIFSLHPLRVECVAWISGRHYALATIPLLACLIAYLNAVSPGNDSKKYHRHMVAAVVFYGISLLCFPVSLTLPLLLVMIDTFLLKRLTLSPTEPERIENIRACKEKIPFIGLAIGFGVLMLGSRVSMNYVQGLSALNVYQRVVLTIHEPIFYLMKFIIPTKLLPYYELPKVIDIFISPFIFSGIVFILFSWIAIVLRKRQPIFTLFWVNYLIVLLPTSCLMLSGEKFAADRYTYISFIWMVLFIAYCLWRLAEYILSSHCKAMQAMLFMIISISCLSWFATQTVGQTINWKDSEILWKSVVRNAPDNSTAYNMLGNLFDKKGDKEKALKYYKKSMLVRVNALAVNNVGAMLEEKGKVEQAIKYYQVAQKLSQTLDNPYLNLGRIYTERGDYQKAIYQYLTCLKYSPRNKVAHNRIGNVYAEMKEYETALANYKKAISIDPYYADTYFNIGNLMYGKRDYTSAISYYKKAINMDPKIWKAYIALGYAYFLAGLTKEAETSFVNALKSEDKDAKIDAYIGLGNICLRSNNVQKALQIFSEANNIYPNDAQIIGNLGCAYTSLGEYKKAMDCFKESIRLNPKQINARTGLKEVQKRKAQVNNIR